MTLYSAGEREPAAPIQFLNDQHPQDGSMLYISTPLILNLISFRYGMRVEAFLWFGYN